MTAFVQLVINGILFGSMYGIAAIGLSLIFGTMRIIFLAQGSVIVLFAYLVFFCYDLAHVDPYLSLLIAVPAAFVLGLFLYYLVFRKAAELENKNVSLLIAVGLMYLLDNAFVKFWTANTRGITLSYAHTFRFWGLQISMTRLILVVLAVLSVFVVYAFLRKTRLGTAVRGASEDMEATKLQGINSVWVCAVSFAVGIALAGVAGVAMVSVYSFDYKFGFVFSLKALVALTLGGVGNVFGALVGGVVLGVLESFAGYYLGMRWIEVVSYGVFILVLTFMPHGLFGRRGVVRDV